MKTNLENKLKSVGLEVANDAVLPLTVMPLQVGEEFKTSQIDILRDRNGKLLVCFAREDGSCYIATLSALTHNSKGEFIDDLKSADTWQGLKECLRHTKVVVKDAHRETRRAVINGEDKEWVVNCYQLEYNR